VAWKYLRLKRVSDFDEAPLAFPLCILLLNSLLVISIPYFAVCSLEACEKVFAATVKSIPYLDGHESPGPVRTPCEALGTDCSCVGLFGLGSSVNLI